MKSKYFLYFSLFLSVLQPFSVALAATPVPADFAYGMELPITDPNGLYTLSLPLAVYERLYHDDHSDIQVFNGAGELVPQVLQRPTPVQKQSRLSIPFFPLPGESATSSQDLSLRVQRNTDGTILSIHGKAVQPSLEGAAYLLDLSQCPPAASQLELTWNETTSNQMYTLRVARSRDLSQWQTVIPKVVVAKLRYQNAEVVRQNIPLSRTSGPYLRLECKDCRQPFQLTQVTALIGSSQDQEQYQWSTLTEGHLEEEPGWYHLSYETPARLGVQAVDLNFPQENSLSRVIIESRPNQEADWHRVTAGDFYRLDLHNDQFTSAFHPCARNTDRYWRVSVAQTSALSKQQLPNLSLGWRPESLIVLGRGAGPYTLAFGSSTRAQIDITQAALVVNALAQNGEKVPLSPITPGPLFTLGGEQALAPQPETINWQQILLWAVLLGGVAILGFMAWSVAREMKRRNG